MKFSPYDVVTVPLPYSDRLAEKRRPALVVSHRDMPVRLGRPWLAMITSVARDELGDAAITDIRSAGLPVPSVLRASKLATLDAGRVIRIAGHFSEDDQTAARRALLACAGF